VMASWERCLFGVVPSKMPEPLGVVALEAMSRGKAVVASATGGIPDMVVDGETGLLFPPGDVQALRAAMQRLIDEPDLRARLGAAAFERVTRFTADAVMPAYEELYRRATAAVDS
jgi:glycosyltransferase involved in cell wall biosynthesis